MKFSNDKKSSLFIYANEITKGSDDKMEVSLKKELEATKAALKLQTIRCRQLVAAFTRKLHEKELELRASKDLRDQQLSRLLRALLILESRLKKEQKLIKQQLEEKDSIIRRQEKEIDKYKRTEASRKPEETKVNSSDDGQRTLEHSLQTGEERLDNLCKGILNTPPLYLTPIEGEPKLASKANSYETTTSCKKDEIAFKDNPVLESVNQILLRDEEELLKTGKPVAINLGEKEERNEGEDAREWYETNGNTIQDENMSGWSISLEDAGETRARRDVWPGGKTSPIKCQLLEEKACLEMSKKNLTVVDLEEIDAKKSDEHRSLSPVKSTASYEEIAPVPKCATYKPVPSQQKPPALPPKPARLLKPHQILQQQQQQDSSKDFQKPHPEMNPHRQPQSPSGAPNPNKPLPNKKPTLNQIQANTRTPRSDAKPTKPSDFTKNRAKQSDNCSKTKKTQLNSHLPSALDLVTCPVGVPFVKQKKSEDILTNCRAIKIGSSVSSLITGLSRETIVTELNGETIVNTPTPTTTTGATSNLPAITLNNNNNNNNLQDTVQDDSHVSQLVRQFEVLGKNPPERKDSEANDIRKNFEEFKLEESYAEVEENGRHEGDGAENKTMLNYYATLTIVPPSTPKDSVSGTELDYKMYETFLESTGLSQKSILTPSRMLSNHRSCLKPKDVKHRNRVKAAAAFEKCNINTPTAGPMVKYWTEPFL